MTTTPTEERHATWLELFFDLARRDPVRAGCLVVPTVAAALVVLLAGGIPAEGVVWVLAAGVLVALAANARSER